MKRYNIEGFTFIKLLFSITLIILILSCATTINLKRISMKSIEIATTHKNKICMYGYTQLVINSRDMEGNSYSTIFKRNAAKRLPIKSFMFSSELGIITKNGIFYFDNSSVKNLLTKKVNIEVQCIDQPALKTSKEFLLDFNCIKRLNFDGTTGKRGRDGYGGSKKPSHGVVGYSGQDGGDISVMFGSLLFDKKKYLLMKIVPKAQEDVTYYHLFPEYTGGITISCNGGEGGDGGKGGKGKAGTKEHLNGYKGGNGGAGGIGGRGGLIEVHFDKSKKSIINRFVFINKGGKGGKGGIAGQGGSGYSDKNKNGKNGQAGKNGSQGSQGQNGPPIQYVNSTVTKMFSMEISQGVKIK